MQSEINPHARRVAARRNGALDECAVVTPIVLPDECPDTERCHPKAKRDRSGDTPAQDPGFANWDASLKVRGINPGTSADLSVATAWVDALLQL